MSFFRSLNSKPVSLLRSDVPHYNAASQTPRHGGKVGLGATGLGRGKTAKRHRKVVRDTIKGITKGDIRRLARRGGVKRMSALIYEDVRTVLRRRIELIMKDLAAILDLTNRKTVMVTDVVFVLNRLGNPIYGFGSAVR